MFHDVTLNELRDLQQREPHTIIDVRSPKEFEEATIPGSVNIPIFDNDERAEVGTVYNQEGQEAAKERGLAIFSKKLPDFIEAFKQIQSSKTVFCWRGGMRSKTAATVLDLMGVHANRLEGGIRTYRRWVVDFLDNASFSPEIVVLNGYTGTGKTEILHRLKEAGYPVIDLEGMANHRGSIFGQVGRNPSNQKRFDAQLSEAIIRYQDEPFVFMEGESKRIGRAVMPDFLYQKKEQGTQLYIQLPVDERVQNILEDYQPWDYPEAINEAFQIIKKRIHTPVAKEIDNALTQQDFATAVRRLLDYYYDPRYNHSMNQSGRLTIDAEDVDDACRQIQNMYPLDRLNKDIS